MTRHQIFSLITFVTTTTIAVLVWAQSRNQTIRKEILPGYQVMLIEAQAWITAMEIARKRGFEHVALPEQFARILVPIDPLIRNREIKRFARNLATITTQFEEAITTGREYYLLYLSNKITDWAYELQGAINNELDARRWWQKVREF